MAGFMRQPKIINDPTAAPASLRADDVDLQAETGDFIMGYPAMQQSGPRVRSLVEQAMLKAKAAGVKTKGQKTMATGKSKRGPNDQRSGLKK